MEHPETCSMRPFRPLLPAKRGFEKPQPAPTEAPLRKRNPLACDSCREKRVKCDGARPTCDACSQRSLACHYDGRKSRHSKEDEVARRRRAIIEKFLELIKSGTAEDAVGAVRSLRAGTSIEAIVGQAKPGDEHATTHFPYDTPGLLTAVPSLRSGSSQVGSEIELSHATSQAADALLRGEYDALAKRVETMQAILDFLRCMPDNDAQCILRELRSASQMEAVLHATKVSDHSRRNAEQTSTPSLPRSMHRNFEPELNTLYPRVFPSMNRFHDSSLTPGPPEGMADLVLQDPWTSDPIIIWELPGC